jgi:hypothetical protein
MRAVSDILDIRNLAEVVLLANTPGYIYSRYRRDPSVREMAEHFDAPRLITMLEEFAKSAGSALEDRAKAYATLVSLSFRPAPELQTLYHVSLPNIEWFDRIKALVLADAPRTTRYSIDVPQTPTGTKLEESSGAEPTIQHFSFRIPHDAAPLK